SATWHSDIKVIASQVATSINGLHDHPLSCCGPACHGQFITCAAPLGLSLPVNAHGSKAISKIVRDGPRSLVSAHKGGSGGVRVASGASLRRLADLVFPLL